MINRKIYLFLFLLFPFSFIHGQANLVDEIDANIVNIIKHTIELNPNIQLQRLELERKKANIQNSQSVFDLNLSGDASFFRSRNNLIESDPNNQFFDHINARNGQLGLGLAKNFQNSMALRVGVDWLRSSNSSTLDEFGQATSPFLANNKGNISLNLTQPLLQGKGRNVAMADIRANENVLESQTANLIFLSAYEVFLAINAYWQYVAAYELVEVFERNEARVQRVLDMTVALIEADKKPQAELIQIKADLAENQGLTIIARQNLFQTKQQLQKAIGFNETIQLGDPMDSFPTPEASDFSLAMTPETLYPIALDNRLDLQALSFEQSALEQYLLLSNDQLKPQLNLGGTLEYGGLTQSNSYGNLLSLFASESGQNWNAGLSLNYTFPIQNNRAQSQVKLQQIELQEQNVLLENEKRKIKIDVNVDVNNLKQSYAALLKSQEALDLYVLAFTNEQEKFQNGLTDLFNVILFQERLTAAEQIYIGAKQQFATDLLILRFDTGTLLNESAFQLKELTSGRAYKIPGTN